MKFKTRLVVAFFTININSTCIIFGACVYGWKYQLSSIEKNYGTRIRQSRVWLVL